MTGKKKRFLVVDDENLIRFFLKEFFHIHDLHVEEAINGREAIEKWEQYEFAAILMDIKMPEVDGLEATRIIRRREKDEGRGYTPIFGISGCTYQDFEGQCDQVGMDGFIAKPVDFDRLAEVILPLA
ncbi:MAG: response regulator [Deltaproteobacteria bacterium]|nr:response regulator [Deltaproteobacteria bacterium]